MNKVYGLLLFFMGLMYSTHGQKVVLQGVVSDSIGKPVEMANVVALNQNTNVMDAYSITSAEGRYRLSLEPDTPYQVRVSYLGLETKEFTVTLSEDRIEDLTLNEAPNQLDEVEVTYEIPVTVKGDTIVYNTDSFVSGTERKLADVLSKLPGIEVNEEGQIEVEGKAVTKVMVEGKDFFDGDSKLASENIPANALDKIEVLRNYNEVSQLGAVTNNEDNVALNIKLKEGKKRFWFGEILGGLGLDDRYIAKPKLFYYSPEYSINILGDINNIGELPFTIRDYFNFTGGFRNILQRGGTNFNPSSNDLGISLLQNDRAREINTRFGAINFSYSPTEKWDLSGFAIYSYTDTDLENNTNTTYITSGIVEEKAVNTNQLTSLGLAKLSSSYKPGENLQLDYDILLKLSDQQETINTLTVAQITENVDEDKQQKPISVNQNLNLYYTINAKNILAVEAQHLFEEEDPFYNAIREQQPFIDILPLDTTQTLYNINQQRYLKTQKLDAKVDYYYITGPKSNINFTLGTTRSSQDFDSGIFQFLDDGEALTLNDAQLNNDVGFTFSDLFLAFHYKFIAGKFTFTPGITAHTYQAKNTQLGTTVTDNLNNVVPDLFVKFQIKKSESLRFNYTVTREFTDISNLARGYIINNYNSIFRGNRDLESALYHNLSLNFFSFSMFNQQNIFANITYNRRIDPFKNDTEIEGINRVNTIINSNLEDDVLTGNANYQRTFGRVKVSARTRLSYSYLNNIVNQVPTVSESFTQNYRVSMATSFRDAPNLEVGYDYTVNDYDNAGTASTFYTDSPFARFDAAFLKHFTFRAEFDYFNYRDAAETVSNEYNFLDASLSYQKKDSPWEFTLNATNLLDNTDLNQDTFNEQFFSTSIFNVQPRFVTLQLRYTL